MPATPSRTGRPRPAGCPSAWTHSAALLDGADLEALEVHQALQGQLPAEPAAELDAAMTALDFPTALTLCRRLRATLEAHP